MRFLTDECLSVDLINRVLEVDLEGEDVALVLYDLPPNLLPTRSRW